MLSVPSTKEIIEEGCIGKSHGIKFYMNQPDDAIHLSAPTRVCTRRINAGHGPCGQMVFKLDIYDVFRKSARVNIETLVESHPENLRQTLQSRKPAQ